MKLVASLEVLFFLTGSQVATACTTIAVGREVSLDGSVLVAHSDDAHGNFDMRLCYIPPMDHEEASERPVYFSPETVPRYVGTDRGSCYHPEPGQEPFEPIGFIPQVAHTFGYYEASYGVVNDADVSIAESTCSAVYGTTPINQGGKAMLSVDALTQIAMERATTAKGAIELMGEVAERYGFYGAGSFEGTAESLFVGDPDEVWVFHILPDPTGETAIWAAQRVPPNHVAVVSNMFIIREIDFEDSENFLWSETVRTVAESEGWWNPSEPLDFTRLYSEGEYAHKFYTGRRTWGAYRRLGLEFPSDYDDLRYEHIYPVSAQAPEDRKVSYRDLFGIYRDYYQGTDFDMTRGLAAGPWADPDRWQTVTELPGAWERSIGLFRTTLSHVVQTKRTAGGSIMWYGPHSPAATVYFPLTLAAAEVPSQYSTGSPLNFSDASMFWAHRYVFNVAKVKYSHAMGLVSAAQSDLEDQGSEHAEWIDTLPEQELIRAENQMLADNIFKRSWNLVDEILQTYSDGWDASGKPMSYPDWWLEAVGYTSGPPPPPALRNRTSLSMIKSSTASSTSHTSCDDVAAQGCVARCSMKGFSVCATRCTDGCASAKSTMKI